MSTVSSVALWLQKYQVKYEHIQDVTNEIAADGWIEEENVLFVYMGVRGKPRVYYSLLAYYTE
jgi:hypothetical protein